MTAFEVRELSDTQNLLKQVIALGDAHNKTMGMFPRGAFQEYCLRKRILVATCGELVIGYLLFRISRSEVSIVHFCVSETWRGKSVAEKLFGLLKELTPKHLPIGLRCREEFEHAARLWKRLGFVHIHDAPGRSKKGSVLAKWRYFRQGLDLFTSALLAPEPEAVVAVIDANIFFALEDKKSRDLTNSRQLTADWLSDRLRLLVTPEIFHEIDRSGNVARSQRQRAHAQDKLLPCHEDRFARFLDELMSLFPLCKTENDISDLRHLAHCLDAEVLYFITMDGELLEKASILEKKFGLRLLTPLGLIEDLDYLENEQAYQPERLGSTAHIETYRATLPLYDALQAEFMGFELREPKKNFWSLCNHFFIDRLNSDLIVFEETSGAKLGLLGIQFFLDSNEAEIKLLRARRGSLQRTTFRFLVAHAVAICCSRGIVSLSVSDRFAGPEVADACREAGFLPVDQIYFKRLVLRSGTAAALASELRRPHLFSRGADEIGSNLAVELTNAKNESNNASIDAIEHLIWPSRVLDADIPVYLVPIRPFFAMQLLHHDAASGDLFGSHQALALQLEKVYYKSVRNDRGLSPPAKILWYVSKQRGYQDGIVACSRVVEVVKGRDRDVYKMYKRLGIYEWKHVQDVSKRHPDKLVMAIRFDDTIKYEYPCPLDRMKTHYGLLAPQCPTIIPTDVYARIHAECER